MRSDLRWGHELIDLQQEPESVALTISSPERDYSIRAQYVVGADGGHSLVRKTLGVDFPGTTSPTIGRIAHVHIPDGIRHAEGGVVVPGFGRVPFGHSRFDRGGMMFGAFEPDRTILVRSRKSR